MATETASTLLKRAFLWHWHLLGLGTAAAFAVLTGPAAVAWVPLVAAAELGYLGFLGFNPRFQNVLRGKEMMEVNEKPDSSQQLKKLMSFLLPEDKERFRILQSRCNSLLDLRRSMEAEGADDGTDAFRSESLDRLLWLFLKLLHQRSGIKRFLESSNRASMSWELSSAEDQLRKSKEKDQSAGMPESRLSTSIQERITTIKERMVNFDKAAENLDIVAADIEKTEQQITHLCEVGMTMRDSASLSARIDSVSASLKSSETAFRLPELESILADDDSPPVLISGGREMTAE